MTALGATLLIAFPATAQVPAPLDALLGCRALPEGAERLACFDRTAAALSTAIADRDLVVTDRQQRAAIAKNEFGRPAGAAVAVERKADGAEPARAAVPARIDATIARAAQLANGRWSIVLDTGARWQQADDRIFARDPRAGMKITITRAALGSYLGKVDGQIAVRLRRVD
ncbi:hypothetical protein [Sphingomonas phyllosphaerae]|uniref:hypothetical protein n=1 Tax=Sphingomonas phyllosphaerae TaxID=257003 RepID=UPI0003F685C7|nr:hypothetical protein [Sphingomonas phyllosphaerae]